MNHLIEQGPIALFFAMAIIHAIADFPLQGSWLAQQKNRHTTSGKSEWVVAITAHSLIHAGGVWLITGSMLLGGIELVFHSAIDLAKSEKRIGLITDQSLHLLCKAGYAVALVAMN